MGEHGSDLDHAWMEAGRALRRVDWARFLMLLEAAETVVRIHEGNAEAIESAKRGFISPGELKGSG